MPSLLSPRYLLADTSVWIAYFLGEEGRRNTVCDLFEQVVRGGGTILYAPTSLKDVFYIVPRRMRRDAIAAGHGVEGVSFVPAAWACVRTMTEIACAATQSLAECDLAWMLRNSHDDLEDNLIMAAVETCGADCVATYDRELLDRFAPACATPEQLLRMSS